MEGSRGDGRARAWLRCWGLPILVGFGSATLAFVVADALVEREEQQFRLLVESGARRMRSEIRAGLNGRMHSLSILVREWEDRFFPRRVGWESDVRLALSQSPGLEAIAWIGPDGEPSWVYPPEAELPPIDVEALRREGTALRRSVLLEPAPSPDGEPRLSVLAPLRRSGTAQGWLAASYRSHELLSDILGSVDTSYAVSVSVPDLFLFREGEAAPEEDGPRPAWKSTQLTVPGGVALRIVVEPSAEMLSASRSSLPYVARAGGVALSFLLMLALGLRNVASLRARALEAEVQERVRAEAEIRRLNEELEARVEQRTAELSRSNESLQRFASFLSHELRQPLGSQLIWIDLLAREPGVSASENARHQLESLRASVEKMSDLIAAQLELSSTSASAEAPRRRVSLAAVVEEVRSGLERTIARSGAKLQVAALPDVYGDASQLDQLFRNLIENAIKYAREGTPAEIEISASGGAERAGVEVHVRDNGRGFAPADAARIFEPDERLAAESAEGQGLGLAICRSIVQRHGGRIRAEGRPGEGATFVVSFSPDRLA